MALLKKHWVYILSRATIAGLFGFIFARGFQNVGMGVTIGLVLFIGFLYYLLSNRFVVDSSHPLFPIRLDEREQQIRNRALRIAAAVFGVVLAGLAIMRTAGLPSIPQTEIALGAAALTYLVARIAFERVM